MKFAGKHTAGILKSAFRCLEVNAHLQNPIGQLGYGYKASLSVAAQKTCNDFRKVMRTSASRFLNSDQFFDPALDSK